MCLAFFVLVVAAVLKNAFAAVLMAASQSARKGKGFHMKNSLKTVGITLIASLFEVVVGLGASLLASAALALGPSDALRSAKSASVQK
ncbi:MAG: hypothetical protein ABIK82_12400 [Pseudomonadota bacterium]